MKFSITTALTTLLAGLASPTTSATTTFPEELCEIVQPLMPADGISCHELRFVSKLGDVNSDVPTSRTDTETPTTTTDCVRSVQEYDTDNDGTADAIHTTIYGLVAVDAPLFNGGINERVRALEEERDTDADGTVDETDMTRWDDPVIFFILFPTFSQTDDDTADGIINTIEMTSHTYDDDNNVVGYNYTTITDDATAGREVAVEIGQFFYDNRGNNILRKVDTNGVPDGRQVYEYDNLDREVRETVLNENGEITSSIVTTYVGDTDLIARGDLNFGASTVVITFTYNSQGSVSTRSLNGFSQLDTTYTYAADGVTLVATDSTTTVFGTTTTSRSEYDENGIDIVLSERRGVEGNLLSKTTTTYSSRGIFSRQEIDSDGDGMLDEVNTATNTPVTCPSVDDGEDNDCDGILCFIGNVVGFIFFCF